MKGSQIRGNQLVVNGRAFYIRGAEIHYFRLRKDQWSPRLEQCVAGGINTISAYLPWYWHEPSEGAFDLTGETAPERDLRSFLERVRDLDLKFIARPGPFINSELRLGGFPEWLFRDHPETLSRRGDGSPAPGRPLPAEGEPLYRAYVRKWFARVAPLVAEFDINRGGPVILFQPDNELSAAWSYGLLNSLYDPEILARHWPGWLRDTYGDIAVVNRRHGSACRAFEDVEPPRAFPARPGDRRRCFDWMNFKRHFFADWGAVMARWATEEGVQVPQMFNEPVAGFYGHGDHAGFGAVMRARGIEGVTACHTYSDRIMDMEGLLGAAMGIELVKSSPWAGPPLSVEVNAAWYTQRLSRSQINWETLMRLGLGHGLMGFVIYPYAAGLVTYEDVINAPEYWPQTCLDLDGRPTAAYDYVARFNAFVRSWEPELTASRTAADLTVAYTGGQRLLDFFGAPPCLDAREARPMGPGGDRFDAEPTVDRSERTPGHDWLDGYEGVSKQKVPAEANLWTKTKEALLLLKRMNVSFELLDLAYPNRGPGQGWIVVPCTGSLEAAAIQYLLDHLDGGGGCLFFPTVPGFNLDGEPDRRLLERLGVRVTGQIRPAGGRLLDYGSRVIDFGSGQRFGTDGWIFVHEVPAGSTILATHAGAPVAARLPARSGRAILVGLDATLSTLSSIEFWNTLIRQGMGVEPTIESTGNFLHALLRKGDTTAFLTVMNAAGLCGGGRLQVRRPAPGVGTLDLDLDLDPHEARCLVINAPLLQTRIVYSTSEVVVPDRACGRLTLGGHAGTRGEIALADSVEAVLDGRRVRSIEREGVQVIAYTHTREPLTMELLGGL